MKKHSCGGARGSAGDGGPCALGGDSQCILMASAAGPGLRALCTLSSWQGGGDPVQSGRGAAAPEAGTGQGRLGLRGPPRWPDGGKGTWSFPSGLHTLGHLGLWLSPGGVCSLRAVGQGHNPVPNSSCNSESEVRGRLTQCTGAFSLARQGPSGANPPVKFCLLFLTFLYVPGPCLALTV